MESILIKTAQLLLSLSILVILHEFGHFIFARLFKTRVEKFYLFFNPWFSLFKVKKGETEYGIGWLPLGGYVKIAGMIDESMDKEAMKLPPQPYEFRSKPSWQRLFIMVGGVLMNFLFALIIYIGVLYVWGEEYLPTSEAKYGVVVNETGEQIGLKTGDKIISIDGKVVEDFIKVIPTVVLDYAKTIQVEREGKIIDVEITDADMALLLKSKSVMTVRSPFKLIIDGFMKKSPAQVAGVEIGDEVTGINGKEINFWDEFEDVLSENKGESYTLELTRNGENISVEVQPMDDATLGITYQNNFNDNFKLKTIKYGFFESIPAGINLGVETTKDYLKQFKLFFKPETKAYESLGGFITIGSIFPGTWDWYSFWKMTAFISIILAIMNLLPIPALDGGHVMFTLYEMISGRKPNEKFLEYAQIVGMVILMALVLYANANDIIKLFK
ncbi:MAG: RIP metalloprotease RseP [Prolixibacteraceae bacterium]|nr:RIP metalloprotease RseP [Prolixibacteraceae bacterium]